MSLVFNMVGGGGGGIKLTGIAITKAPTKTTYTQGETFDSAGMVVTATYSNGATLACTGYSYEPNTPLADGTTKVTMNKALTAAELGDNSFLNDLGINTDNNPTDYERRYQLAQLAAQYGDYSGLRELGINPDAAALNRFNTTAAGRSASGGGGNGGGNTKPEEKAGGYQLTANDISTLKSKFPNGVIDDATWNSYVAYGVSEETLKANGFTKNGTSGGGGNGGGFNSSYFNAAMSSLRTMLRQGRTDNAVGGIDSFWNKLSAEQKEQVQKLLGEYGLTYTEG